MPKTPYSPEKAEEDGYENISFGYKSPGSKTDLLILNDNTPHEYPEFEKYNEKTGKVPVFSGIIQSPKYDKESSTGNHRYQRFKKGNGACLHEVEQTLGKGSNQIMILLFLFVLLITCWTFGGDIGSAVNKGRNSTLWTKMKFTKSSYNGKTVYGCNDPDHAIDRNKEAEQTKKYLKSVDYTPVYPSDTCINMTENMRFDCLPQDGANSTRCVARGCCWKPSGTKGVPFCYYPRNYNTFRFVNMSENERSMSVFYEKDRPSGYPGDFNTVRIDFKYLSNEVLQIKMYDPEHNRFEPPYPELATLSGRVDSSWYRVVVEPSTIGFKVIRTTDNVTIINTQNVGGLIMSDKMLQISSLLPTSDIYGLGEKRSRLKNDMNWQTIPIFNRDRPPMEGMNLYGSHPFYMALESYGRTHGMLLLNSNAMDVVLQPTPAITYRATGGILNFYVFMGPSPSDVVSEYTQLIGRPFFPPYWSLGFHLCKYGYKDLNETKSVWQANRDAGIPFDVQWNDIDYMRDHNDFSYDEDKFAGLPKYVDTLHKEGMRYVIIIDAGVGASEPRGTYPPFDLGLEMDVFIKNTTNQPFIAKVWNSGNTVFPDFTHPNSTAYWVKMMTDFHNAVPYDGAWLDMNEPSNFLDGQIYGNCKPENLPYMPKTSDNALSAHTLCMEAKHYAGKHFDLHNLHPLTEAIATNFALTQIRGSRPFIISRASFVGLGHYAGHWSGDIASDWHDMKMSIPELLSFSLFGVSMMGADICGFNGNTTVELCKRWMQLGAFYPFSRNHNSIGSIPQDPASLGPEVVEASRNALRIRYRLLPYYYTMFWRAHLYGDTVARPLFFESAGETVVRDIDTQFMIGPHVLVNPILEPGATTAKAYFPKTERWYNFLDGSYLGSGEWKDLMENETIAVKGGAIIPLQEPPKTGPVTTTNSRSAPFQLMVVPSKENTGYGELFSDDGESLRNYQTWSHTHLDFSLRGTELTNNVLQAGYEVPPLNKIYVLNQPYIKSVYINDAPCVKPCEFSYIVPSKMLIVRANLSLNSPFAIKWTYKTKAIYKVGFH